MPVGSQTVGKDYSVNMLFNGQKVSIAPNAITGFETKPNTTKERRKGLDGVVRNATHADGWMGTFDVDRLDATLDNFWASYEANYYAGINTGSGTITETIQEVDGSITQWRYTAVQFTLETSGQRDPDKVVKQKISFEAAKRLKVQ